MRAAKRPWILAIGTVSLLCLGLIYAYSVLMAPLKEEFTWPVSGVTLIFAISMIFFIMGNLLAGSLMKRGKERWGFVISAALLLAGFVGASLVDGPTSLWQIYLWYGVVASLGIGVAYNIVLPTVTAWFPDMTGPAQGACLMGFGAGGFVLGPVVTQLYTVVSWRMLFLALSVVFAFLILTTSRVVRMPTTAEVRAILNLSHGSSRVSGGAQDDADEGASAEVAALAGVDARVMLHDATFYLLYAFLFLIGSIGLAVTGVGVELPLALGVSSSTATFVIGFVNIGSGLGRLFGGVVLDRASRTATLVGIGVIGLCAPVALAASLTLGSVAVQAVGCLLSGIAWGAAVVTMPYVTRSQWGQRNMSQNMAIVNTYSIFASLVGSWGAGLLVEMTGSFTPVLTILAVMAFCGTLVAALLGRRPTKS